MSSETFLQLARDPTRRNTLIAASLGWMLDSMDVMLFSLLTPALESDLRITAATAGGITSTTLIAAAIGASSSASSPTDSVAPAHSPRAS